MREYVASAALTRTRTRSVATGAKVTVRLTRLLPVTVACVTQADPFQVWTWNAVTPYCENVIASVGGDGDA